MATDHNLEVAQFRSSQRILNPNQPSPSSTRKSLSNEEKKDIVQRWKAGYLETKQVLKGAYVQIIENSKVTGHICVYCEKYFIGSQVGGAQRKHECVKPCYTFTSEDKQIAKDASLKMIKTDLFPFAIVEKPGFLGFTKAMLEIGAELGQQNVKSVTIDDIKALLPHPTTLSNHINKLATKKQQLYAILKRKSNESGIALMLDGTSKTYHYTGISIAFIDDDWRFQTLLTDLISGHGVGESTASYAYEKAKAFLEEFGIDISILNAVITDEASAMVSAFASTKKHIICICHMISTICKHTIKLYAKDKADNPSIHQSLEIICALKKKLKLVVTTVRSRIHINKSISNPLYQSNETRFLSFSTSLNSFLSLNDEDHRLIEAELSGHQVYGSYLELIESKNDLKTIYNILYPSISALRTLEVEKSPTLHLVLPALAKIYKEWEIIENWDDPIEYSMKTAGLWAIQEKVSNLHNFHYFAVILDPNTKMDLKNLLLQDRAGQTRGITELIQKLRESVKSYIIDIKRYRPRTNPAPVNANNPFAEALTDGISDSTEMLIDNDITHYLMDEEKYSSSILGYWKSAASNYPFLSKFAKFLLSIPASSCPLERSFSVLNKVDCKERPQLNQETITNIVLSNALEKYVCSIP